MSYAEYLENYGAMNMSINKSAEQIEAEKASYIEYVQIPNTKQEDVKTKCRYRNQSNQSNGTPNQTTNQGI